MSRSGSTAKEIFLQENLLNFMETESVVFDPHATPFPPCPAWDSETTPQAECREHRCPLSPPHLPPRPHPAACRRGEVAAEGGREVALLLPSLHSGWKPCRGCGVLGGGSGTAGTGQGDVSPHSASCSQSGYVPWNGASSYVQLAGCGQGKTIPGSPAKITALPE